MSSRSISFNQFVDLSVNPSKGTINTSLLHNLLHIIINQLQLSSSSIIEFHGAGSEAIENFIVNSEQQCKLKIQEFEICFEVDAATGNIVKGQKPIQRPQTDGNSVKLFTIEKVESDSECPVGYPLNPIQLHSIGELKRIQTNSIHDVMASVMPSDDKFSKPENSLKTLFDFINISKRLDALEIGIRQVADIVKKNQCEVERFESVRSELDPELTSLHQKVGSLSDELRNLSCKCNEENFEVTLFQDFHGKITQEFGVLFKAMQSEAENLKSFCKTSIESIQHGMTEFKDSVCDRMESYKSDLINCMTEIQEMLDAKLDKFFVPDLKNYLQEMIDNLEEKIEKVDCPKPLAAGAVMKVFKDLNCVSCGENVIQSASQNPVQSMLMKKEQNLLHGDRSQLQLLKLSSRLCGGNHTITEPRERIFRSEKCQN